MVTRSLVWLLMEEHELWPVIAMASLQRHTVNEVSRELVYIITHQIGPCCCKTHVQLDCCHKAEKHMGLLRIEEQGYNHGGLKNTEIRLQ